jgi:hypothetical protein
MCFEARSRKRNVKLNVIRIEVMTDRGIRNERIQKSIKGSRKIENIEKTVSSDVLLTVLITWLWTPGIVDSVECMVGRMNGMEKIVRREKIS